MTRDSRLPAPPLPPTLPPQVVRAVPREPEILVGMQKFAFVFLATALLGLVVPVEGVALVDRETNADRFARGLPPLPPRADGAPQFFFPANKPGC